MPNTQLQHRPHLLVDAEKMSHIWLENSPACTKIVDPDLNLQYMSEAGVKGLHIDDISNYYGKPYPLDFYPSSFRQQMNHTIESARQSGEPTTQEAAVVDLNGKELWFHSTIVPVFDDSESLQYFIIVSIDTTDRKTTELKLQQVNTELESLVASRTKELEEANKQLIISSETDYLTQIPNRRSYERRFNENIATAKRNNTPLSLLMIDIDDFKSYNDHYGHDCGDLVLRQVADSISSSLKRDTDFLARFGGEEFVVLLPETDTRNASAIAEQIRLNINKLSLEHTGSITGFVNVSLGIESLKGDSLEHNTLLKHADVALYQAKNNGKDQSAIFNSNQI